MFELLQLILLTIISYAFLLFRCESMGTGDFADDNPGTAIPTSDQRRVLRGLRSFRYQDLALSTGSAAAGGLAGLDDHDNLVVETPLTLGPNRAPRISQGRRHEDESRRALQRRVEVPAVHERPVTLSRVRTGVVSSVPVLRRVDIGTEVSRSRSQGHQTARHRFSRY